MSQDIIERPDLARRSWPLGQIGTSGRYSNRSSFSLPHSWTRWSPGAVGAGKVAATLDGLDGAGHRRAGGWDELRQDAVDVPATMGLERGRFRIRQGIQGMLVADELGRGSVYLIISRPAATMK